MTYRLTFRVKGDHKVSDFELTGEYDAVDLDGLAHESWDDFRKALHFIWKKMESGVFMDPRPNSLMSVECYCDKTYVDELEVLNAFYRIRTARAYHSVNKMHQKL